MTTNQNPVTHDEAEKMTMPTQGCNRCMTTWTGDDPRCPQCSHHDPMALSTHSSGGAPQLRQYISEQRAKDAELVRLREECVRLAKAGTQLRGALELDHMVQEDGKPYGTTVVACQAWDATDAAGWLEGKQ